MADRKLFTLTLSDRQGRYVSYLLDEAVSDQPDFLVAAIAEMKGTLLGEPEHTATRRNPAPESADPNRKTTFSKRDDNPLPLTGAPLLVPEEVRAIPKEVQERVDAEVREQLAKIPGSALYKRPVKDTPQA
jgi:hypothetical protein